MKHTTQRRENKWHTYILSYCIPVLTRRSDRQLSVETRQNSGAEIVSQDRALSRILSCALTKLSEPKDPTKNKKNRKKYLSQRFLSVLNTTHEKLKNVVYLSWTSRVILLIYTSEVTGAKTRPGLHLPPPNVRQYVTSNGYFLDTPSISFAANHSTRKSSLVMFDYKVIDGT